MKRRGVAHRLDPRAVTAPTLPLAESATSGMDLMVRLVINFPAEPAG